MNDTIAGTNIRVDNLGHVVPRVADTLLEDGIIMADGSAGFSVSHVQQVGALQIFRKQCMVSNGMEQQNIGQQYRISKDCIQQVAQLLEGFISWCKDGPCSVAQGVSQICLFDGRTKSREVGRSASNLS